jgi:hypothetical protein
MEFYSRLAVIFLQTPHYDLNPFALAFAFACERNWEFKAKT